MWRREDVIVGLPGYTKEPSRWEMSLGVARKKVSSEYEMNDLEAGGLERVQTECSQSRTVEGNTTFGREGTSDGGETRPHTVTTDEPTPPYLPPPERAVVRNSARNREYPDQVYISALGPGGRRVQF